MPICSVAPSSMRVATCWPMARATGPIVPVPGSSSTGRSASTTCVSRETWMKASPSERGIRRFTSAITVRARSAAAFVHSTPTPKEQKPCSSGGETWMRATSMGRMPDLMRRGISERWTGTKSARPSLTASRTFWPMKSARWRKAFA